MADNQMETDELIFEAACRVFQRKGYAGARMQEIADEAGINKSMLHYYYRNKDKLFQEVYQQELSRFLPVIFGVLDSNIPFNEKVEQLVEAYYSFLQDNPHIVPFVLLEMNRHPERFKNFIEQKNIRPSKNFSRQIEAEISAGHLKPADPNQLMISIIALILFPFVARTMIEAIYDFDEADFSEFLQQRKHFITDFILNAINYQKQ